MKIALDIKLLFSLANKSLIPKAQRPWSLRGRPARCLDVPLATARKARLRHQEHADLRPRQHIGQGWLRLLGQKFFRNKWICLRVDVIVSFSSVFVNGLEQRRSAAFSDGMDAPTHKRHPCAKVA